MAENEFTRKTADRPLVDISQLESVSRPPRRRSDNTQWKLICPECNQPRSKLLALPDLRLMCASCHRMLV